MKRIISALAVIAIVSSALAFAPKGASYCASTSQNFGCQIINGKTEAITTHGSSTYYKYNAWDGNSSNCLSNRCETQVTLYNEL